VRGLKIGGFVCVPSISLFGYVIICEHIVFDIKLLNEKNK